MGRLLEAAKIFQLLFDSRKGGPGNHPGLRPKLGGFPAGPIVETMLEPIINRPVIFPRGFPTGFGSFFKVSGCEDRQDRHGLDLVPHHLTYGPMDLWTPEIPPGKAPG